MKISKTLPEKNVVKLKIELSAQECAEIYQEILQGLAYKTNLKGFRPGKVPPKILSRLVNQEELKNLFLQEGVKKTLSQALDQEKLKPFLAPRVEIITLALGQKLSYKAKIILRPEVKLGSYTGFGLRRKKPAKNRNNPEGHWPCIYR